MKKLIALLLALVLMVGTATAESATASLQEMYAQAELLMVQGDYAGAAAKFEALSAYSDAAQMTLYCKAIYAATMGMYPMAVDALNSLGQFKDASQLAQYYSAVSYLEYAKTGNENLLVDFELYNEVWSQNILDSYNNPDNQNTDPKLAYCILAKIIFEEHALYKDSLVKMAECDALASEIATANAEAEEAERERKYQEALEFENEGNYEQALAMFEKLGTYKDCVQRVKQVKKYIAEMELEEKYQAAIAMEEMNDYDSAIELYKELGSYKDCEERLIACEKEKIEVISTLQQEYYSNPIPLAAGYDMFIARTPNGEFHVADQECAETLKRLSDPDLLQFVQCHREPDDIRILTSAGEVLSYIEYAEEWRSQTYDMTYGKIVEAYDKCGVLSAALFDDHTVITGGHMKNQFTDVAQWKDIIDIAALHCGDLKAVAGVQSDGTVKISSVGMKLDVSEWKNIAMVDAGEYHLVGVQTDGRVVATLHEGYRDNGQCDVSEWSDIIYVSANDNHTVGLKRDGTVVAVGLNDDGRCDVSDWSDVAYIAAGFNFTVAMKTDGTLLFAGDTSEIAEMLENVCVW